MKTHELIMEISSFLNIRATGRKILQVLAKSRGGLLVSEIIARSRRSERAVRAHLKHLLQLRLIKRKSVVTKKGKLAYRYLIPRVDELVESTQAEIIRQLRKLESYL
jgi:predicted transcriptional regulator